MMFFPQPAWTGFRGKITSSDTPYLSICPENQRVQCGTLWNFRFKKILTTYTPAYGLVGNLPGSTLDLRPLGMRPVHVKELPAWRVNAFIDVGAKVVALCLEKIRRRHGTAITVEIS